MNSFSSFTNQSSLDQFLDDLEAELEVPESQYEAAERSYHSVGNWLNRKGSALAAYDPQVYVQGSFRLGTAIKPFTEDDEYDVDAVCELRRFTKQTASQSKLKQMLGTELKAYAAAQNMLKPVEERRRCWTLHYADGAQFHLDVVPALPNSSQQIALLMAARASRDFSETAIAITDNEHGNYQILSDDWPRSNPKGYCEWFRKRIATVFEKRRKIVALQARASVESIPDYKVRTPLQSAIKFLKRHRDIMFSSDMSDAPISIIITTLAAHAYQGEETTSEALVRILTEMPNGIVTIGGVVHIVNPSDPFENFADKWAKHPERKQAFFEWLERARADFSSAKNAIGREDIGQALAASLGSALVERSIDRRQSIGVGTQLMAKLGQIGTLALSASHRRKPRWPANLYGSVKISSARFTRNGFRAEDIVSNGRALERRGSLRFQAVPNIPEPYKVYWQIVNTGKDAERARGLRGTFEYTERGGLVRDESTLYRGTHSIECFIVKNDTLVARSGQFLVSIE